MEYFKDLRENRVVRLTENKDRFIQKSTILTDDQKKEVLDFFRSHANLENRIQNWNYNIPYETFKQVIDSVDTVDKRLKKQTKELRKQSGLEGLVEGEDYNLVYQDGSRTIYQPFNHKASRVIASNMVEPKIWCESKIMDWTPKEVLPAGEPMKDGLYPGAKWCISMESDKHWNSYIGNGKKFFIVCNPKARTEKGKKVCLVYDHNNEYRALTYADDSSTTRAPRKLVEIIDACLGEMRPEKYLSKYLNKETGRYDYLNKEFTLKGLIKDGKFIVPIGVWEGNFNCSESNLTSLEGAPREVGGYFDCSNNRLTSLQGAPREVGRYFNCSYNQLTTLEGAPKRIGDFFKCTNNNLTSLQGAPEKVSGYFDCSSSKLLSLEGAPREVERYFDCSFNKLTSLQSAPEYVGGYFNCSYNQLTTLEGAPREVGGGFGCGHNQLTTLEGAPEKVGEGFGCSDNKLTSLKGAPREVSGDFICWDNNLTSLEGAPEKVGESFYCYDNPLTSLEGKPEHIGGRFFK